MSDLSSTPEERSFAPIEEGVPVSETKPIPVKNATVPQVARGINAVHACLEEARSDINRQGRAIAALAASLGIPTMEELESGNIPARRAKTTARWDVATIAAVIGATGGGLVLFKIIAAVAPVAWKAILSVS